MICCCFNEVKGTDLRCCQHSKVTQLSFVQNDADIATKLLFTTVLSYPGLQTGSSSIARSLLGISFGHGRGSLRDPVQSTSSISIHVAHIYLAF